jgi:hypothetical protein
MESARHDFPEPFGPVKIEMPGCMGTLTRLLKLLKPCNTMRSILTIRTDFIIIDASAYIPAIYLVAEFYIHTSNRMHPNDFGL